MLTGLISSSSSLSSTPPKEFEYHISVYRTETPMGQTAAYMNLLAAMNEVAFMPQQLPLDSGRIWSLSTYDTYVMVKSKEVRFAVWGLLYIFEALNRNPSKLRPMTIDMAWEGKHVGEVHIGANSLSKSPLQASNGSTVVSSASLNTSTSIIGGDSGVQYIITPNGGSTTIGNVFRVALRILANSAEIGVERPFIRIEDVDVGFSFTALLDRNGASMMTQADLMRFVTFVARKMVADDSFKEVRLQLLRNGRKIGEGQLSAPRKALSR